MHLCILKGRRRDDIVVSCIFVVGILWHGTVTDILTFSDIVRGGVMNKRSPVEPRNKQTAPTEQSNYNIAVVRRFATLRLMFSVIYRSLARSRWQTDIIRARTRAIE